MITDPTNGRNVREPFFSYKPFPNFAFLKLAPAQAARSMPIPFVGELAGISIGGRGLFRFLGNIGKVGLQL